MVAPPRSSRASNTLKTRLRIFALMACAIVVLRMLLVRHPHSWEAGKLSSKHAEATAAATAAAAAAAATTQPAPVKVKVGWIGHVFGERPPPGLTFQEAQPICTDNSGNLVWAYGAWKLVDPNATELVPLIAPPFSTPVDAVLLPTANMLVNATKYKDVESYTHILTNLLDAVQPQTAPIMLIAIGSQTEFEEAAPVGSGSDGQAAAYSGASRIVLHPEQIAFLKRIHASGGFMTTRGRFTEAIFTANGLPAPLPISCGSFFLNHNPQLGAVLQQKWDAVVAKRDPNLRLGVTLPNIPADSPEKYDAIVQFLAERVLKPFRRSAVVVLQTTRDYDTLEIINERYGVHIRPDRVVYYYDVESWIEGVRKCCDFLFGFRIHGTMAGVAAEVPGFLVAPDLRVKELAEAMAIPTIDMDKADLNPQTWDLFDFIKSVPSYSGRFDSRRREVARVYAREFGRLKVPLHPGIANIANQPDS